MLLLPIYRQKLKQEAPALKTIQCGLAQSDSMLQDCFDHLVWEMFWSASDDDIEVYSDTVTVFIRKCIENVKNNTNVPHPKTVSQQQGSRSFKSSGTVMKVGRDMQACWGALTGGVLVSLCLANVFYYIP